MRSDNNCPIDIIEETRDAAMKHALNTLSVATFFGLLNDEERKSITHVTATEMARQRDRQILAGLDAGEITHAEAKRLSIEAHRNPWPDTAPWPAEQAEGRSLIFASSGDRTYALTI